MAFAPSGAITGATVTGLTSPTYTVAADVGPSTLTKQYVVTALGGTQTDVSLHSVASPFLVSLTRPAAFKPLSIINPTTGRLQSVPRNVWKGVCLKGATPLSGQASVPLIGRFEFAIPAGVDSADPNEIKAFMSFFGGLFWNQANGITASFIDGVI